MTPNHSDQISLAASKNLVGDRTEGLPSGMILFRRVQLYDPLRTSDKAAARLEYMEVSSSSFNIITFCVPLSSSLVLKSHLFLHTTRHIWTMGEHTASKAVNVVVRFFQLCSDAIILGIVGWALHRISVGNGPNNSRLIYVEVLAAMSLVVSILLLVPFKFVFKAWPLDIIL